MEDIHDEKKSIKLKIRIAVQGEKQKGKVKVFVFSFKGHIGAPSSILHASNEHLKSCRY